MERAMWQNFGQRVDEMTFLDYEVKVTVLALEAEKQQRDRERKS